MPTLLAKLEARLEAVERLAKSGEEQRMLRWEKYDALKEDLHQLEREFDGKLGNLDGKFSARMEIISKDIKKIEMDEAVESVKHSGAWNLLDSKVGWIIAILIFLVTFFKEPLMDFMAPEPAPSVTGRGRNK
jgi:hypothetical protein